MDQLNQGHGLGGGKYEAETADVLEKCEAAGVILLVFEGKHGTGFSVAAPPQVCMNLPRILRSVADSIEASVKHV